MIQRVKGRTVSPIAGVLIVLGLAVSIVLVSWIERAVAMTTGFQYGSFAVWAIVAAEALAVTRLSVMELQYALEDGHFVVRRVYGQNGRVVYDIPVNRIEALGGRDDIFRRYGNAQTYDSAVVRGAGIPEMALVYHRDGRDQASLLVIQPDEAMQAALNDAIRTEGFN